VELWRNLKKARGGAVVGKGKQEGHCGKGCLHGNERPRWETPQKIRASRPRWKESLKEGIVTGGKQREKKKKKKKKKKEPCNSLGPSAPVKKERRTKKTSPALRVRLKKGGEKEWQGGGKALGKTGSARGGRLEVKGRGGVPQKKHLPAKGRGKE